MASMKSAKSICAYSSMFLAIMKCGAHVLFILRNNNKIEKI